VERRAIDQPLSTANTVVDTIIIDVSGQKRSAAAYAFPARPIDAVTKTNWEGVGVKPTVAPVTSALKTAHVRALELLTRRATAIDRRRLAWESRIARARLRPPRIDAATFARYAGMYGDRRVTQREGHSIGSAERRRKSPWSHSERIGSYSARPADRGGLSSRTARLRQ
jgi:hypothetical protein